MLRSLSNLANASAYDVYEFLIRIPIILFSLTVHEIAHGYTAYKLGDPTAKSLGRLSLNPLKHLDPIGALCMLLFGFGWAKPVPINTRYFKKPRGGMALTALAGPMSNILMALLTMILYKAVLLLPLPTFLASFLAMVFMVMCVTNLNLAVFNLIPVHPLDGSRILAFFLPDKALRWIDEHEQIIYIIFMMLILFTNILDGPISFVVNGIYGFLWKFTALFMGI